MCGISGAYNYSSKPENIEAIINKINKIQHLRGPDDKGLWKSNCKKLCFGHTRLSIIDLTKNANQPFVSTDQNYVITFNGEIYNYKSLKNELLKNNIFFKSNSDTEVILEAYKFWGIKFLEKLRGMFAFVIWDNKKKLLLLARDPFGIKPLYFSKKNGIYYFASQAKSLLSVDSIGSDYSNPGITSYYLWGNVQEPYTLYKDITSIPAGSCMSIDSSGNEKLIKYADLKNTILNAKNLNFQNYNEKNEYLLEAISETVNTHQVSDVPITVLLSAGIDSNVILNTISDKNKINCSALTLDFNFKGKEDEVHLARKSANLNKIDHDILQISEEQLPLLLENFFSKMDVPTNDGFNNFLVSYLARKNQKKIILSGIGGDELFFGYPSFKLIPLLRNILKFIPDSQFLKSISKNNIYPILKKNNLKTKYSGIFEYGRNISTAFFLIRSLFLPNELNEFISENILKSGIEELNIIENCKEDIKDFSDDRLAIMYLEIKYYLCSKLLRDADWASMSHSVELRTPFVDWSYFKKIIPLLKSDKKINKYNMLHCLKKNLPDELLKRKKTGFSIPHEKFLKEYSVKRKFPNPLRDWSLLSYNMYLKKNNNLF